MKGFEFMGKLLYAVPMALFGVFHFINASSMSGMVPSYLPVQEAWVYLTGLALILAAVAILTGKKAKLASLLLGLMILSFAVLIHMSGFLNGDPSSSAMFLKDLAISGAAFFMSSKLKN
ncbi:DoxX family protein [Marinoscillum sp.]|uniref:DoxX family protein n=1 Tax=Marinoscillum sp. TaxID=2024838 RepID=UPI003BAC3DF0